MVALGIVIFSIYIFLLLVLCVGWHSIPQMNSPEMRFKKTDAASPKISVLIPVRNEAANILALLRDLEKQRLPFEFFEVLVLDDASEDATRDQVASFPASYDLKIIPIDNPERISPKKNAISQGIKMARGTYIVGTDGDCRVPPGWLSSYLWAFEKKQAVFISSLVTFYQEASLFEKMQTVEFSSLIGTGSVGIALGFPNMCNGANLAYQKKAFFEVGGYAGNEHIASGDDEFLMHKLAKQYPGKILFLKSQENIVKTRAKTHLRDFVEQRKRWAGKWKYYQGLGVKILAFYVFLLNISVLMSLFGLWLNFSGFQVLIIFLLLKVFLEILFLGMVLAYCSKKLLILLIPLVQLFYPFYVIYIAALSQVKEYKWKGRRYEDSKSVEL